MTDTFKIYDGTGRVMYEGTVRKWQTSQNNNGGLYLEVEGPVTATPVHPVTNHPGYPYVASVPAPANPPTPQPNPTPPVSAWGPSLAALVQARIDAVTAMYGSVSPERVEYISPIRQLVCECGAHKATGAKKGDRSHSSWCPWSLP